MKNFTPIWLIIGFGIIIGIGILDEWYLKSVSREMKNDIDIIAETFFIGDIENSARMLQDTTNKWEKNKKILEILVNHEATNKISEALIKINENFKIFSSYDIVSTNFALLKEYIKNIEVENKFTINNIL